VAGWRTTATDLPLICIFRRLKRGMGCLMFSDIPTVSICGKLPGSTEVVWAFLVLHQG
jgi:hypothetical protein